MTVGRAGVSAAMGTGCSVGEQPPQRETVNPSRTPQVHALRAFTEALFPAKVQRPLTQVPGFVWRKWNFQGVISQILGGGWSAVKRTSQVGLAAGQALTSELAQTLGSSDSAVLSSLGQLLGPDPEAREGDKALPLALRAARRAFKNLDLEDGTKKAVLESLAEAESGRCRPESVKALVQGVGKRLGDKKAVEALARKHPNFFPSLLAGSRDFPPLELKGKLSWSLDEVSDRKIRYLERDGRVYAEVTTSLNQLLGEKSPRARRLAEDYASDDIGLKLSIPMGQGRPEDFRGLPVKARRQLLHQALQATRSTTTLVHGFQSSKEIWDGTGMSWADPDSLLVAMDGFGAAGTARSDASAPFTPKQYGFQVLEALDALGLLGGKPVKVVGHSMGGAATGEMAVALDRMGYRGKADFVLMAPACSADHLPIFAGHKSATDLLNTIVIGGIYLPLGAWSLTAPLVKWTDESFPLMAKMMVDHGLGLKDCPPEVREHNASFYRTGAVSKRGRRRARAMEAMMGMASQEGLDPKALQRAARSFGVYVANFGADRLVSPEAVRRLKKPGVGYIEVSESSHNGCFNPEVAARLAERSSRHFASRD